MRKRKKEIVLKGKRGILALLCSFINSVKCFIFPLDHAVYTSGGREITTAMTRRQIKFVASQLCKSAVEAAKLRGY